MKRNHITMKFWPACLSVFLIPVILLFDEILFHVMALGSFSISDFLYMVLFAFTIGIVLEMLLRLIPKDSVRIIITGILLILLAVIFLIEYFVNCQFKIFYDLNTVTAGAGGVVHGFGKQILRIVLRPSGIFIILMMLLVPVVYMIIAMKQRDKNKRNFFPFALLLALLFGLGTFFSLHFETTASRLFNQEYNFQSAVSRFGLLPGLCMDIRYVMSPEEEISFEDLDFEEEEEASAEEESQVPEEPAQEETQAESSIEESSQEESSQEESSQEESQEESSEEESEPEPEPEPEPIVYEPNVMDIDFEALAASSSGTLQSLDQYIAGLTPSLKNQYTGLFEGKNLIFFSAEAFSAEVIDEKLTPTLYRLATKGIQFTDYYQPASAGTTGGEYENLFGMLPTSGGSSFIMTSDDYNYMTMGSQLNRLGYNGWAFHNHYHTFYSRNETHIHLGYSNGFMGYGNGMEDLIEYSWPESDLQMLQGTLPLYIDQQPFNIYYMTVSGHNPYSNNPNSNAMSAKNWDEVKDLPYSNTVKSYLAANLELEHALTYLVDELEAKGIADDTVIVLSADHFPYGLDEDTTQGTPYLDELYGYSFSNYLERDHNRLILWCGCLEEMDPIVVDTPTSSLDILPTLSNLFGTEFDSRLFPGRDVFSDADPLVFTINFDWKTDLGTYIAASDRFYPADTTERIPDDYVVRMKSVVRNKVNYCKGVLNTDYFRHVFEDYEEARQAAAEAAAEESSEEAAEESSEAAAEESSEEAAEESSETTEE